MELDLGCLPVKALLKWSPFNHHVWDEFTRLITKVEVSRCILRGDLEPNHYDPHQARWRRFRHIRRLAYLVINPSDKPLEIDVGVPALGCIVEWPLMDGNHRLGAAIYRGDEFIKTNISGDIKYAKKLFKLQ